MSSVKVLLVRFVPHLLRGDEASQHKALLAAANSSTAPKTGLVLENKGKYISIQGFPDISSKEKHQCWSFFQKALKKLLGVHLDTTICIQLSDPPFTAISNLSEIFQQSSHVVDLIVTPLPYTSPEPLPISRAGTYTPQSRSCPQNQVSSTSSKRRDPYYRYKEMFHCNGRPSTTGQASSPIKRKCDYAEMNRLLSQLDEINLTLERTQLECDKIAVRCGPAGPTTPAPTTSDKTSLTASDSGKGSSGSSQDHTDDDPKLSPECAEDKRVERLLEVAESIAQHLPHATRGQPDTSSSGEDVVSLPDPPTGVTIQPSITDGGVYVMWNPVRLDASDQNHGHTVLSYMVYLDKKLRAKVDGPLSSHAELVRDLEEDRDYMVQVCTHTNHCNSLLSSPVKYRHNTQSLKQSRLNKMRVERQNQESKSKTARVESWLLNGHISLPVLADGVRGSITDDNTTLSPHVHFALGNSNPGSKWAEQVDIGAQLLDSGCEDTRSNASSHTSGIVTDFPMSPHVKQAPVFSCPSCRHPIPSDAQSLSTHFSNVHSVSDDGFHTLTRCTCPETGSSEATKSTRSSTLCPSCRSSRAGSEDITVDTIIDEPLEMSPARHPVSTAEPARKGGKLLKMSRKVPEAPGSLSVHQVPGEPDWLQLDWEPVSRDSKGCSNGFFVLGYRIYVNNVAQKSVNGAMTSQAKIPCPPHSSRQPIAVDVRSRAMAGESAPSTPVHYSPIAHPNMHCEMMSDNASSSNLRCPSVGSSVATKSEGSVHTIQKRNKTRMETVV